MPTKTRKKNLKPEESANEEHVFVQKNLDADVESELKTVDEIDTEVVEEETKIVPKKKKKEKKRETNTGRVKPVTRSEEVQTSDEDINSSDEMEENASEEGYEQTSDKAQEHESNRLRQGSSESKHQKEIEHQLKEIYKNDDGSLPDMKHFQMKQRGRFARALLSFVVACGVLGGVGWYGFFVWKPTGGFSENNVIVSISGDENILIGEEAVYRVRYVNDQKIALNNVSVHIRYPEGFVFTGSSKEPVGETKDTWEIGTLGPEESGYFDIEGKLFGNIGEKQSFRMFLNYTPENFSSEFQRVSTVEITAAQAPLALEVTAPSTIVPGVKTTLILKVKNNQEQFDAPLALEVDESHGFSKKESSVPSDQFHDYRWTLPKEKEFTLTLEGVFTPEDGETKVTLPVRIRGWDTAKKTGEGYVLAEQTVESVVQQQAVALVPVVNGATESLTVQPGEVLSVSVLVRNSGDAPLEDVELQAILDAPSHNNRSILNWSSLQDDADGKVVGEQQSPTIRRGSITWSKAQFPELATLGPGQEKRIDFQIPIQHGEQTTLANYTANTVTFVADMRYRVAGETKVLSSAPITMTLNSDTALDVQEEREERVHTITWALKNSFHPLKNVRVKAEVYGDTTFDESKLVVPAGQATFDKDKKVLTWTIEEMPLSVDVLPLQFQLTRNADNPSQTQLMSRVEVRAIDAVTGEEMILVGESIEL